MDQASAVLQRVRARKIIYGARAIYIFNVNIAPSEREITFARECATRQKFIFDIEFIENKAISVRTHNTTYMLTCCI